MKAGIEHWKAKGLDFSKIFHQPRPAGVPRCMPKRRITVFRRRSTKFIEPAKPAIERARRSPSSADQNVNRTAGTMLSGEVAKRYGHAGLPDNTIHVKLTGTPARASAPSSPRRHARTDRRGQRLCRQGPVRRAHRGRPLRSSVASRRRTSSSATPSVWRDRGRIVLPRALAASASAVRLRRHGGRRRRGRPRLRIHDRRHRGRARQYRPQLRAGMSGGIAYVLDPRTAASEPLQPRQVRLKSRAAGAGRRR